MASIESGETNINKCYTHEQMKNSIHFEMVQMKIIDEQKCLEISDSKSDQNAICAVDQFLFQGASGIQTCKISVSTIFRQMYYGSFWGNVFI